MGGKMSRNKGKRAEYLVRDALRALGRKDAVRVPLSGASEGYKGDVAFTDADGVSRVIEVKSRKSSFKTIYDDYVNRVIHHPTLGIILVHTLEDVHIDMFEVCVYPTDRRLVKYFETLYKLKADADHLVIKDNGKPLIMLTWEQDKIHGPTDL